MPSNEPIYKDSRIVITPTYIKTTESTFKFSQIAAVHRTQVPNTSGSLNSLIPALVASALFGLAMVFMLYHFGFHWLVFAGMLAFLAMAPGFAFVILRGQPEKEDLWSIELDTGGPLRCIYVGKENQARQVQSSIEKILLKSR